VEEVRPFLQEQPDYDPAAVARHLTASMSATVEALTRGIEGLHSFDKATAETAVRQTAEASGVKAATLIHATRVALIGRSVSPGLFEMMELLGRDRTVARLRAAQNLLSQ